MSIKENISKMAAIFLLSFVLSLVALLFNSEGVSLLAGAQHSDEELTISLKEAKLAYLDKKYLWVDSRSEPEYNRGHIPGAVSLPLHAPIEHKKKFYEDVPKTQFIITYCVRETCPSAKKLARELRYRGYKNTFVYVGGWVEWRDSGMPQEKGGQSK